MSSSIDGKKTNFIQHSIPFHRVIHHSIPVVSPSQPSEKFEMEAQDKEKVLGSEKYFLEKPCLEKKKKFQFHQEKRVFEAGQSRQSQKKVLRQFNRMHFQNFNVSQIFERIQASFSSEKSDSRDNAFPEPKEQQALLDSFLKKMKAKGFQPHLLSSKSFTQKMKKTLQQKLTQFIETLSKTRLTPPKKQSHPLGLRSTQTLVSKESILSKKELLVALGGSSGNKTSEPANQGKPTEKSNVSTPKETVGRTEPNSIHPTQAKGKSNPLEPKTFVELQPKVDSSREKGEKGLPGLSVSLQKEEMLNSSKEISAFFKKKPAEKEAKSKMDGQEKHSSSTLKKNDENPTLHSKTTLASSPEGKKETSLPGTNLLQEKKSSADAGDPSKASRKSALSEKNTLEKNGKGANHSVQQDKTVVDFSSQKEKGVSQEESSGNGLVPGEKEGKGSGLAKEQPSTQKDSLLGEGSPKKTIEKPETTPTLSKSAEKGVLNTQEHSATPHKTEKPAGKTLGDLVQKEALPSDKGLDKKVLNLSEKPMTGSLKTEQGVHLAGTPSSKTEAKGEKTMLSSPTLSETKNLLQNNISPKKEGTISSEKFLGTNTTQGTVTTQGTSTTQGTNTNFVAGKSEHSFALGESKSALVSDKSVANTGNISGVALQEKDFVAGNGLQPKTNSLSNLMLQKVDVPTRFSVETELKEIQMEMKNLILQFATSKEKALLMNLQTMIMPNDVAFVSQKIASMIQQGHLPESVFLSIVHKLMKNPKKKKTLEKIRALLVEKGVISGGLVSAQIELVAMMVAAYLAKKGSGEAEDMLFDLLKAPSRKIILPDEGGSHHEEGREEQRHEERSNPFKKEE